jgi:hypothetical protein
MTRPYLTSDNVELTQDAEPFTPKPLNVNPPKLARLFDSAMTGLGFKRITAEEYYAATPGEPHIVPPAYNLIPVRSIDCEWRLDPREFTRTPVAPFKPRQRIAIPGGRIATVESMRRNKAEGTGAFGAWMVEARPDGIIPGTDKCWPIETHFASDCRE